MRTIRVWALIAVVVLGLTHAPPVWALSGVAPVAGPVTRGFDPPAEDWFAGHRGVDLSAVTGATVVAAAAGTVTFAGTLAGRGVVVVDHGDLRTTYEPVTPLVHVGDQVAMGQAIATLDGGHAGCRLGTCLHWGLLRDDEYLDPLSILGGHHVRLLPGDAVDAAREAARARAAALGAGVGMPGILSAPAAGPITSGYGERMHPILHIMRMHDGVDIGAPCDAPIRAAAPGRVESVGYGEESGNRLVIDHGAIGGHRLRTIYMHASGYSVDQGERVERGETVGRVGTTGLSTGCHLHFSVTIDGESVDPQGFW